MPVAKICAEKCIFVAKSPAEKCGKSMERLVIQKLVAWRGLADRKPLVLNGARQVGKTWLLREFARRMYAKEAYFVCRKNQLLTNVFKQDFDTGRILRALRAMSGVDITPGDTLIILDEVQDIPEAIEALKYFCEEVPEYHIAVAGSLLGISIHENVSYPVGKVNEINVCPMSFEEFLLAKGEMELSTLIAEKDYPTLTVLHERLLDLLRQYYFVGGMPEAVKKYVETEALQEVRRIQKEILHGYELDFSKHAPKEQLPRIRLVWQTIPSQLFKENKKFIYGALRKGARAKDFEMAIEWLVNAGLIYKVPLCGKVALPLKIYEDTSVFKLYMVDLGLLGAMVDTDPQLVLLQNNVFTEYKGGITEQYVLQQMKANSVEAIYYHKSDETRLEIDFMIQRNGQLLPIEVKAGQNVRANSLTTLLQKNKELVALRYSMLPYREQEQMTCLPLYLAR